MTKSFVDPAAMEQAVRAKREQEELAAKAAKAKTEAEKKDAAGAPEAAAPAENVFSFRRMKDTPLEEFLEDYKDLAEQVRDKGFLLKGYATIERKIWGQTLRLRTLRKNEHRLVSALSEDTNRGLNMKSFLFDEQARWFLLLMVQQFSGETFTELVVPRVHGSNLMADQTREMLTEFVASKEVVKRLDLFDNMPREVYDDIVAICIDTLTAMTKLVERDLRNP